MSWLFERLQHLVSPSKAIPSPPTFKKPVKILLRTGYQLIRLNRDEMNSESYRAMALAGGQTGSSPGGDIVTFVTIDDFLNEGYPEDGQLEQYRKGKDPSDIPKIEHVQIGKAILHELAIHAWRFVYFSDVQANNRDMNSVEAFLFNKHRAEFHGGWQKSDEHNWADVETDMIELYHPAKPVFIDMTDIVQRCSRIKKSRLIAGFERGYKLYWNEWEKKYRELLEKKNK